MAESRKSSTTSDPAGGPVQPDASWYPYAARVIRYRTRQLVGSHGILPDEVEDLQQETILDLLNRLPKYDASKAGLHTFISRLVDHAVATILERRRAARRDYRVPQISLDSQVENENGNPTTLGELLDAAIYLRRTGRADASPPETLELRTDLEHAIGDLPEHLQQLCTLLLTGFSMTEISRETGIPRTTLYEFRDKIRIHLARAGLGEYL